MTSRIAQFSCLTVLAAILLGCSAQAYYGANEDKRNFDREFMHFGKRANVAGFQLFRPVEVYDKRGEFDRNFMPFGKRDYDQPMEKKQFNREFMHFGKRSAPVDGSIVLIRL